MSGYALMLGCCVLCNRQFSFNPVRVPSLKVQGVREPMCEPCFHAAQAKRVEAGVEPWPDPQPDAWKPCREEELG